MRKYPWIVFAVFLVWLSGCEKVVDLQVGAYQPNLVVYGALLADSVPRIMVGETRTYYGWEEYINSQLYVEGAQVSIAQGQEQETLQLGSFTENIFNIWDGTPGGYQQFAYKVVGQGQDSSLRFYEGEQRLASGQWYDFKASYGELNAERSIYLPQKGQNLEATFRTRDTSYRRDALSNGTDQQIINETRFELVISYDINDTESNLWHKPIIRSKFVELGYTTFDPNTQIFGFVDDSFEVNRFSYAPFERLDPALRNTYVVQIASFSVLEDQSTIEGWGANLNYPLSSLQTNDPGRLQWCQEGHPTSNAPVP
ncbi:MAG: hypothetical protein AAF804_01945, partial [Bacteroidota bacterium]